jgi:prepilin-type N-terminal cleavage/methylation domain-containing protein
MQKNGFTLIEMSIVLVLWGLILTWSWQWSPSEYTELKQLERFQRLIDQARTYALNQGVVTRLCPTQDFKQCTDDWNQALMVQNKAQEKVIARLSMLGPYHLSYHGFGRQNWFEFSPKVGHLASNGHWNYCLGHCYTIVVNRAGRSQVKKMEGNRV